MHLPLFIILQITTEEIFASSECSYFAIPIDFLINNCTKAFTRCEDNQAAVRKQMLLELLFKAFEVCWKCIEIFGRYVLRAILSSWNLVNIQTFHLFIISVKFYYNLLTDLRKNHLIWQKEIAIIIMYLVFAALCQWQTVLAGGIMISSPTTVEVYEQFLVRARIEISKCVL